MRTWGITEFPVVCGVCKEYVKVGEPVLTIEIPGVKAQRFRCRDHAGEPMPAEISSAPLAGGGGQVLGMTRISADVLKRALPFDHKAATARNDE